MNKLDRYATVIAKINIKGFPVKHHHGSVLASRDNMCRVLFDDLPCAIWCDAADIELYKPEVAIPYGRCTFDE
jgi:hypothetical protein